MGFKLYDYQKKSVEFGVQNNYCILGLDPGLGKTLISLTISIETRSKKTLIICPAYLKLKWQDEINKFYPGKAIAVIKSSKDLQKLVLFDLDFVIISYGLLDKADNLFEWSDMVIADECHFLKEMKTKRTETFHRLIYENSVERCLLLTGTPVQNRIYEFYSLIAICNYNPKLEESSFLSRFPSYVSFANYFSYLKEFEMMRGGRRVRIQQWEGVRTDRLPDLFSHLKNIYITFKSDEVLDLPPYVEIEVPVELSDMPDLLDEFNEFSTNNTSANVKAKAEAALLKAPFTVEYVKGLLDSVSQVVIYTDHIASCELIADGLDTVAITGKTPTHMRERLAKEFMDGKRSVLVATIGSFSTGIDLYRSFNMVINDLNWVPGNMKQAKYRIRRIGQMNKCFFHYILGTNQDKIIKKKLEAKMNVIREIY